MKTLIILSAFLLVLSSCTKECPVPDTDPDPVYSTDPGSDSDTPADPGDDDPGYDDPPSSCFNDHSGNAAVWMTAASFSNA
jgi:hypothetical protein